jgi:hypothetical protein
MHDADPAERPTQELTVGVVESGDSSRAGWLRRGAFLAGRKLAPGALIVAWLIIVAVSIVAFLVGL